jgi:hypothetical protein
MEPKQLADVAADRSKSAGSRDTSILLMRGGNLFDQTPVVLDELGHLLSEIGEGATERQERP